MSRVLSAPVISLLQAVSRAHHQRVRFAPPGGEFVDLTDYLLPGTVHEEGINEPVDMLVLHFDRSIGSASLSPLMTEDPPIDVNFDVVWEVAVTSQIAAPVEGDWIEKFRGSVWDIDATHNDMVVTCEGLMGKLRERLTLPGQIIDADTELEDAIQAVLDGPTPPLGLTLSVPVSPDASLDQDLAVNHEPVLQAALGLAGSIGWAFRYWWDETEGEFRPTLLEPPRNKVDPDWTTNASRYIAVPEFRRSKADIRNSVTVYYGPLDIDGVQASVTAQDAPSIAAFGLQEAIFREGGDSPIQIEAQAQAFANAFISDLAWPDITHTIVDFDLPNIQLWDLIELAPNNAHYNTTQRYAVQSIRREFPTLGAARITLGLRGKPSAGVGAWKRRKTTAPEISNQRFALRNFREIPASGPGKRRWGWDRGSMVEEIWWAYDSFPVPWTEDNWAVIRDEVVLLEPTDQDWVEFDEPGADEVGALRVEPRMADGSIFDGDVVEQVQIYPVAPIINGDIDARLTPEGADIYVSAQPNPSALPIAWEVWEGSKTGDMLASGEWTSVAAANAGVGGTGSLDARALPVGGKQSWWAKFTDRAGNVQWHSDSLISPWEGSIQNALALAEKYRPYHIADNLTALNLVTKDDVGTNLAFTVDDLQPYIWDEDEEEWVEHEGVPSIGYFPIIQAGYITSVMMSALVFDVGKYIQSSDYDPGVAGWHIDGDGDAEFNDGDFRGSVTLSDASQFLRLVVSEVLRGVLRPGNLTLFPVGGGSTSVATGVELVAIAEDGVTEGVRLALVKDTFSGVGGVFVRDGGVSVAGPVSAETLYVADPDATPLGGIGSDRSTFQAGGGGDPEVGETSMSVRLNDSGTQKFRRVRVDSSGHLYVTL